ncbi:hypothetical protein V8C35DRAFT_291218 [Trichoderma chlorosporum]
MSSSLPSTLIDHGHPETPLSDSTRAFTPEPDDGTVFFARLSPGNLAAEQLFDLMSVGSDYTQYSPHLCKGFYRIGMDHERAMRRQAWTIGTGSRNSDAPNVDIQLYPRQHFSSSRGYRSHIAKRHASIFIHPISGVLMIRNHATIPITCVGYNSSGKMTTSSYTICEGDARYQSTYMLHRRVTRLDFGPLSFNLEIEHVEHAKFFTLRNLYLSVDEQSLPLQVINPFTILDDNKLLDPGEVVAIGEVSGSLSGGISLITGNPYVVKYSVIKPNHLSCQLEYSLMSTFSNEQITQLLPTNCTPNQQPEDYHMAIYTMEMALFSLHSYFLQFSETITDLEFFTYAQDALVGLHHLHSRGIVHGNINPHTLLLLPHSGSLSAEAPVRMRAAISPIVKSAPRGPKQDRSCIAPWLKGSRLGSMEADISALGALWLWCLGLHNGDLTDSDRAFNATVMLNDSLAQFESVKTRKFLRMVITMIASDALRRPTSGELLNNPLWTMIDDSPGIPISRLRKGGAEDERTRRHTSI